MSEHTPQPSTRRSDGCWVIDRKVALTAALSLVGIMLTVAVHTITLTRWLSQMETRLLHVEETVKDHQNRIAGAERVGLDVAVVKNDVAWIRENIAIFHGPKKK